MENRNNHTSKKGGRPLKAVKRDQLLAMKCTGAERKAIEDNAQSVHLTVSEYLRELGLTGKIDSRETALPKELLQFNGTLNHLAANMNQIARKRNRDEQLNAFERATVKFASDTIIQFVNHIKTHFI